MNKIKTPSKQYFNNCISQNLNLLNVFSIVMAALCLLLWLDNETPIFPLTFKIELNYYNITGSFFILYLLSWALIKVSAAYKQLQFLTYWIIIVISFGFLDGMGILELNRGNGLTPLALGYVTLAVIISTRLQVLTSFFLINSAFFYYLIVQTANVEDPHNKMALFTITILSIMIFITVEKHRRKEYETRKMLAKKIEELNRALDVKSVFFGHMSHELRTPLNAIIGFSEMILTDSYQPKTIDKIKEYLRFINSGGEHLLKIVNDILDSSKIEAGEVNVVFEKIDVAQMLQDYIDEISSITKDKQQQVRLIMDQQQIVLNSDKRLLKQIIFNLISNAQKYTSAGGQIDLSASKNSHGKIEIIVKDNGKGMDPEILHSINEKKPSIQTHFITRAEGTGLGLVIVRQLVQLLNGEIIFNSHLG